MKLFITVCCLLMNMSVFGQSTEKIRPYKDWETMAYCSYDSYHPSQYAKIDNNWELLYTLRTPMSIKELKATGIPFTYSQILFLHIGGLIESKNNVLHTIMPIFSKDQTKSIRTLSRLIAQAAYKETGNDWSAFMAELKKQKLGKNAYSLVFSYVLDGKIWGKALPTRDSVATHATWDGAFWALYDKRLHSFCGTNSFNAFHQTWSDSLEYWHDAKTIVRFTDENAQNKKIVSKDLLDKSVEYGLADKKGHLIIPIIKEDSQDALVKICDELVVKLASCVNRHSYEFMKAYQLSNENLAKVILYHEIMWDMMDILVERKIITEPDILTGSPRAQKSDFGKIVYIAE